jgi:hypothetical protein
MVEKLLVSGAGRFVFAVLAVAVLFVGSSSPALANSVVTLCHQDDETGPGLNLDSALLAGGHITFSCGGLATIRITHTHLIGKSLDIDGADNLTLDAEGRSLTIFQIVSNGLSINLAHLTLRRARPPGALAGSFTLVGRASVLSTPPLDPFVPIRKDFSHGTATINLQSVQISESDSPVVAGNADSDVALIIKNSQFRSNTGFAVFVLGSAKIDHSSFIANDMGLGLGNGGTATVTSCTFSANTKNAVKVTPAGSLDLGYSQLQGNSGASGPALFIDGNAKSVNVRNVDFTDNKATASGGAIAITTGAVQVKMAYVTFKGNSALQGGSINSNIGPTGSLTISAGLFDGNSATKEGGGLFSGLGRVLLAGSIFKANSAANGSAFLIISSAEQPSTVANALVVKNAGPGAAIEGIQINMRNVTVAENQGGGILARTLQLTHATLAGLSLENSIVDRNSPFNCAGASNKITFQSHNIQFPNDAACHGAVSAEPLLDPMYAPLPGSPAYGTGDLATCMAPPVGGRDLFFQARGVQGVCSIGALEFAPEQFMAWRARHRAGQNGNQNPNSPPH